MIGKVLELEGLRVRRHLTFWDEQAFGGEDFANLLKVLTPATEGKMLRVLNDTKDVGVTGCFSNGIIQGGSREGNDGEAWCGFLSSRFGVRKMPAVPDLASTGSTTVIGSRKKPCSTRLYRGVLVYGPC